MTIRVQETQFHDISCRPHKPSENACRFTANHFKIKPEIADCHDQRGPPYKLCSITEFRRGIRLTPPHVKCNLSACHQDNNIQLFIVDPLKGNYLVLDLPGTISDSTINDVVEDAIIKTQENGFNFLFIDCFGVNNRENISQLLTFLPKEDIFRSKEKHKGNKVNVNLILLDSISRPHFFRSLRKTVFFLRQKALDPSYKSHLLDFESFQAIHGHTHENEHALFGGKLYPENFTKTDKENTPTNMGRLFGIFRESGYQTMTQSDLCWKAWYGYLRSYMAKNWSELQPLMKKTIDTTGKMKNY